MFSIYAVTYQLNRIAEVQTSFLLPFMEKSKDKEQKCSNQGLKLFTLKLCGTIQIVSK